MNSLLALLQELRTDGFTGRVTVRSDADGWVYLDGGAVSCAETRDRPTLLVEMAEAGLFTPDEWRRALCHPYGAARWAALVDGDVARTAELTHFAQAYVSSALVSMARRPDVTVTVANNVQHPFGTLHRWTVDELVGGASIDVGPREPAIDRVEFLELLEEISPEVHRVGKSMLSVL